MEIKQNLFASETVAATNSVSAESGKSTLTQTVIAFGAGLLLSSMAVNALPSTVYTHHLATINPSKPSVQYEDEYFNKPVIDLNNDASNMLDDYNKFVSVFLANAKNMDSETSTLINDNYVDLLAT